MKVLNSILGLLALLVLTACEHKPFPPPPPPAPILCDPQMVYFNRDILPIFTASCAISPCHDAATAKDKVILDSYNNTMATAGIRPGMPDKSDLYQSLDSLEHGLSQPYIQLIYQWILQGAKNLHCNTCDTTAVSYKDHIEPMMNFYCTSCHSGSNPSGKLLLTNRGQVMIALRDGDMWPRINHEVDSVMPPGIKLDDCKLAQIKVWMESGYPNN